MKAGKIVVAWMGSFVLALVVATSCSIEHRSEGLACTRQEDCTGGRTCIDGVCVLLDGMPDANNPPGKDASVDAPPTGDCPPECTSCDKQAQQCKIDCQVADCSSQVACPAGWHCDIACNRTNSCRNGINCLSAASCTIECSGDSACRNVACGTGRCNIQCSGMNSCRSISCGQSCACDIQCDNAASCETIICSSFQCETFDGCTSQGVGCDICP